MKKMKKMKKILNSGIVVGLSSLAIAFNSHAAAVTQDFYVTFDFVDNATIDSFLGFSEFSGLALNGVVTGTTTYDAVLNTYEPDTGSGESFVGPVDVMFNIGDGYTEADEVDISVGTAPDVTLDNGNFSSLLFVVDAAELLGGFPVWSFAVDGFIFELADTRVGYDLLATGNVTYGTYQASAVPVPAAAWLFGTGLVGLVGVARRNNRS